MKFVRYLAPIACAAAAPAGNTPVGKVIRLLKDLKAKAIEEKEAEIKLHYEVKMTTHHQHEVLDEEVADQNELNEREQTKANKHTADSASLNKEADDAQTEHDKYINLLAAKTKIRNTEKAEYESEHAGLKEGVDALAAAIEVVKKEQGSKIMTAEIQKMLPSHISALVAAAADPPQATQSAYDSQTGGVLKILEDLHDKFAAELETVIDDESSRAHAYAMDESDLSDEIKNYAAQGEKKRIAAADEASKGAAAQSTADDAGAQSVALTEQKQGLTNYFAAEDSAFTANQALRAREIDGLTTAIGIMTGDDVAGSAERHLPTLIQQRHSFLQLGSTSLIQAMNGNVSGERALLLQKVSNMLLNANDVKFDGKSRALNMVAVSLITEPTEGPLGKVVDAIEAMIKKVQKQADDEEKHQGFCAVEIKQSKTDRDDYTQQVSQAASKLAGHQADKADAEEAIKQKNEEITALIVALQEAIHARADENLLNTSTAAEAVSAEAATRAAIQALKDSGFVDESEAPLVPDEPEAPVVDDNGPKVEAVRHKDDGSCACVSKADQCLADKACLKDASCASCTASETVATPDRQIKAYKGAATGSQNGVMGLLSVIAQQFAHLNAQTIAAEASAVDLFKMLKVDIEMNTHLAQDAKINAEVKLGMAKTGIQAETGALAASNALLDAANAYYEKLKPACVQEHVSYEKRKAMREEEVASLRQALEVLENDPRGGMQ